MKDIHYIVNTIVSGARQSYTINSLIMNRANKIDLNRTCIINSRGLNNFRYVVELHLMNVLYGIWGLFDMFKLEYKYQCNAICNN